MAPSNAVQITTKIQSLIADVDGFKGVWCALGTLEPDRLFALRRVTTIECTGSSTRTGGSSLSEREKLVLAAPPELSLQIVEFAREHGCFSTGDTTRLTRDNHNTLKQHFRALLKHVHLSQYGAGWGVWHEMR